MISKEIIAKDESYITEEDRIAHRMAYYALVDDDYDELREAFSYIYKLYHDKLYVLALSKVDIKSEAEDVVLDSLADLCNNIMAGKDINNIKSYLYRIFLNNCIDYNLSNKKFRNSCYSSSTIYDVVDLDDFIVSLELNDLIDRLLTAEEKYILIHYIIKEESLVEIKDALNLKNIDIYKMYKKILAKLRKGVSDIYD